LLLFAIPSFDRLEYLSLPAFNDLHHVRARPDGRLIVVNTGLDMVMVLDWDGDISAEMSAAGEPDPWARFSRDVDYRGVLTTKPHKAHPNYSFLLDGEIWATRCEQKDAICLTAQTQPPIPIGDQCAHDGVLAGGKLYFTTVDGLVHVFDAASRERRQTVDLNRVTGRLGPLGWCRGLCVLENDVVVVGFTRLRRTKFKEKVAWAKYRLGRGGTSQTRQPAHIAAYDLRRQQLLWEANVEQFGMHVVFSIHPA
jgi:hypothetical protein